MLHVVMMPPTVLFFDTETTGLPANRRASPQRSDLWPHIVQLSFLLYDIGSRKTLDSQDFIVTIPDDAHLPKESVAVHGITRARMKMRGVPISVALDAFESAAAKSNLIVAHNLEFDLNVLKAELWRLRRCADFLPPIPDSKTFCTMEATRKMCNITACTVDGRTYVKYPRLEELYHHQFGVSPSHMHDAMADVLACLRCYVHIFHGFDVLKCDDLAIRHLTRMYA